MYPLLESADGMLNLTHVTVRGNDVHVNGEYIITDALKFVVSMDVVNSKVASMIQADDGLSLLKNGRLGPVWDLRNGTETYLL